MNIAEKVVRLLDEANAEVHRLRAENARLTTARDAYRGAWVKAERHLCNKRHCYNIMHQALLEVEMKLRDADVAAGKR